MTRTSSHIPLHLEAGSFHHQASAIRHQVIIAKLVPPQGRTPRADPTYLTISRSEWKLSGIKRRGDLQLKQ